MRALPFVCWHIVRSHCLRCHRVTFVFLVVPFVLQVLSNSSVCNLLGLGALKLEPGLLLRSLHPHLPPLPPHAHRRARPHLEPKHHNYNHNHNHNHKH